MREENSHVRFCGWTLSAVFGLDSKLLAILESANTSCRKGKKGATDSSMKYLYSASVHMIDASFF
jgi:hypothetical protein